MQIFLTFRAVLSHSPERFCHHSTYEGADKKKRETMKRYIFQKMLKINFTLFVCAWKIHQLTFLLKIFKKCNKWSIHKDALQLLLHNSRHFIISGSFISQRLGCHSETSSFILRWLTFLSCKWSFLCWWTESLMPLLFWALFKVIKISFLSVL